MKHPLDRLCPKCGAGRGELCVGKRWRERKSFHRDRGARATSGPPSAAHNVVTESPLEDMLVAAIFAWMDAHGLVAPICTQRQFGPYRADMWIQDGCRRLVIECDGVRYHNSDAQIERDKRRDRFCAVNGIAVMRFTGREIMSDPRGCAAQVGAWLRRRS